jgi:hypothetical protein
MGVTTESGTSIPTEHIHLASAYRKPEIAVRHEQPDAVACGGLPAQRALRLRSSTHEWQDRRPVRLLEILSEHGLSKGGIQWGHGWTLRPSGNVVVVVGAAAAAAPAWVRPVRSGVVFPLPKMRLQTVPTAEAISA